MLRGVTTRTLHLFAVTLLAGCAGGDGQPGADGRWVDISEEPAGDNCEAGGERIDVGVDEDGDGNLTADEIENTSYVCNGADPAEVLVVATEVVPGSECRAGGERVDIGPDDGEGVGIPGNGILEDDEIDESLLLCLPCQSQVGEETLVANGADPTEGSLQTFVVPDQVCAIRVSAAGAQGGAGSTEGALIEGTFEVTPGDEITVLVGKTGATGETLSPLYGGGGTFVMDAAGDPLIIAGGGGSCFFDGCDSAETVGRAVTSGGAVGTVARSDNGQGGSSTNTTSGAGGGLLTGGANAPGGGGAYVDGAIGGAGETFGGYGGGGARLGSFGQGGGGGYSGGSCGDLATEWVGCGGGGSFNAGVGQVNQAGVNVGDGYVTISY